ncbi:MAG: PEP-CTERM sorting domain-containing protein [Phycisphaerae bacterium]|nr:PEP-CTERM sorting domain-containing protein [Gemmatimonadaceae bacterium]
MTSGILIVSSRRWRASVLLATASLATGLLASVPTQVHAQLIRSAAGIGASAVQGAFDQFRIDLGGGTTAGPGGSFGGIRREINWDALPFGFSAPNNMPANFFNMNSQRGVVLSTPGAGFQVSGALADVGTGQPAAANFGNIDATYSSVFSPFSAQRLFTPISSNVTDVSFFLAGTNTAGLTRGFGSIFSDVDLANISSIQLFGAGNVSLGSFFVPNFAQATAAHFSFLGVSYATPTISRVRITTGNAALSSGTTDQAGGPNDLVVMDDFVFGEVAAVQVVPEPATLGLLAVGMIAVGAFARKRKV